jgi:hypothetical protein
MGDVCALAIAAAKSDRHAKSMRKFRSIGSLEETDGR